VTGFQLPHSGFSGQHSIGEIGILMQPRGKDLGLPGAILDPQEIQRDRCTQEED
jgi:hypothetical protein